MKPDLSLEKNESAGRVKASFITCNGDGLYFDDPDGRISIFDEIQLIIDRKDEEFEATVATRQEASQTERKVSMVPGQGEEEFTIDDVADNLNASSMLVEIIEQMEQLKENLQPL